eukprot:CAMPEP_0174881140 /NCGR_PEP_ID=MMETSP1114-20130205/84111_1 /TAXON_ID=312471 /ORGANISM="Neobodo designis, Strain CCAP 1951/1" /LENGTH=604 /DNA_ID=CAMNT_0016116533 /DNA_START=38 /DNA_END=1852 /DNA_ORIENTATION=-
MDPPAPSEFVFVEEPQRFSAEGTILSLLMKLVEPGSASGAHRIAIEQLYTLSLQQVEPYILQLMHAAVTHTCDRTEECLLALRSYLASVAAMSLHVGLRMAWNIDSVAPVLEKVGITQPVEGLRDLIESAAVNRNSLLLGGARNAEDERVASDDPINAQLIIAARKAERVAIFNDERRTLHELIGISDRLRQNPDRDARKGQLRDELASLNAKLRDRRVYLPVATSSDKPKWIVRAVPSDAAVFSSRERAPFLLVVEMVEESVEGCSCGHPALGREAHPAGIDDVDVDESDGAAVAAEEAKPSSKEKDEKNLIAAVYGESFRERQERIRKTSPYGHLPGWGIAAMVVKAGDDLRQEELALQLIGCFNTIWQEAGLTVQVRPFAAMATTFNGGILEFVGDALSIDSLKKKARVQSLHHFFLNAYGGEGTPAFKMAQRNFAESMAGYSIISYLLNIKDRHNGNLMLARDGTLIHIDFGFMFASSPGGINFESAPFKLSPELLAVLGGVNDPVFGYFKVLLYQAFAAARARAEELLAAVQLMLPCSTLPSFGSDAPAALQQMRLKFALHLQSETEVAKLIWRMVEESVDNWRTRKYDQFQTWQNGII